jgi:pimeloyl-ACP methyl ester carboxylesterase
MRTTRLVGVLALGLVTGFARVAGADAGNRDHDDDVVSEDHFVTVSSGAVIHVVEKYSAAAFERDHRRAVLMLPATLVTSMLWNADVPGAPEFNAILHTAKEGFLSFSLDWEGYGLSTHPADGKSVTKEVMLADAADIVRWIRDEHHVHKVDLFGSSLGSGVAVALGSTISPIPHRWIGHVVLTANVYKNITPFASQVLLSPAVEQILLSVPNGYIQTSAPFYGIILSQVLPAPLAWANANIPGLYAVGPTLEGFALPDFDAHTGRAPMLQFWGTNDLITPFTDVQQFQAEYGGNGSLVVLNGGGHVPIWEAVRTDFWQAADAFLSDDRGDDDGAGDDD